MTRFSILLASNLLGKPLTELIFEAVIEGKEEQTKNEIERSLTPEQVKANILHSPAKSKSVKCGLYWGRCKANEMLLSSNG